MADPAVKRATYGTYADAERARAVPFDAIELDLAVLWLR
jgi:hypothetical protein